MSRPPGRRAKHSLQRTVTGGTESMFKNDSVESCQTFLPCGISAADTDEMVPGAMLVLKSGLAGAEDGTSPGPSAPSVLMCADSRGSHISAKVVVNHVVSWVTEKKCQVLHPFCRWFVKCDPARGADSETSGRGRGSEGRGVWMLGLGETWGQVCLYLPIKGKETKDLRGLPEPDTPASGPAGTGRCCPHPRPPGPVPG